MRVFLALLSPFETSLEALMGMVRAGAPLGSLEASLGACEVSLGAVLWHSWGRLVALVGPLEASVEALLGVVRAGSHTPFNSIPLLPKPSTYLPLLACPSHSFALLRIPSHFTLPFSLQSA